MDGRIGFEFLRTCNLLLWLFFTGASEGGFLEAFFQCYSEEARLVRFMVFNRNFSFIKDRETGGTSFLKLVFEVLLIITD